RRAILRWRLTCALLASEKERALSAAWPRRSAGYRRTLERCRKTGRFWSIAREVTGRRLRQACCNERGSNRWPKSGAVLLRGNPRTCRLKASELRNNEQTRGNGMKKRPWRITFIAWLFVVAGLADI